MPAGSLGVGERSPVMAAQHGIGSRTGEGGPARPVAGAWTPAHSEAAVFLGECVAVGAVLGFLAELARVVGEDDVRRGPGSLRALTRSG